jgi:S-adenosylmethionine decarboxylase
MTKEALVGRDVVHPFQQTAAANTWPEHRNLLSDDTPQDHFIERNGSVFAGVHLIIDLWGASHLDDLERMEKALRDCVDKAKATLLHIHLHHFTPNGGVSGVAVLAESHISVHTWPERDFAAFDVFMCGNSQPSETIPVLSSAFHPQKIIIRENLRGVLDHA